MGYSIKDKVVLITGASAGIGRACAIRFHAAGSRVIAVARSEEKLGNLATLLGNDRILPIGADVTREADRASALSAARERFGGIDVLINNAGRGCFATVQATTKEDIDGLLALNLAAPIALTQAVLPEMIERGTGQIVNISSVVGNQVIPRMTVYSATKAALSSFTAGLRMELKGTGVDILLVSPGSTRTEFFDTPEARDVRVRRLGWRQQTADHVAQAVLTSCRRRRPEVTLSLEGKTVSALRRFSHRLADWAIYTVASRSMPMREPD